MLFRSIGGIYDFLAKKKMETLQQLELSASTTKKEEKEEKPSGNKLSYREQKELNRQQLRLEKKVEEAEKKVAALEEKLKPMEEQLATPEGAGDMELLQKYLETKGQLEKAMNNWERSTLELEKLVSW